jgi:hypothetical protein
MATATAEKTEKMSTQERMEKARLANKTRNDYGSNQSFQRWLKCAKVTKLGLKDKDILWDVLDTVASFDLRISLNNFDQYLDFLFTGNKQVIRGWVREFILIRATKVTYVGYLQDLLSSNEIDFMDADTYKGAHT